MEPPDVSLTVMDFPFVSSDDEIEEATDDVLTQEKIVNNEEDNNSDEDDGVGDLDLDEYQDLKVFFSCKIFFFLRFNVGRGRFPN